MKIIGIALIVLGIILAALGFEIRNDQITSKNREIERLKAKNEALKNELRSYEKESN